MIEREKERKRERERERASLKTVTVTLGLGEMQENNSSVLGLMVNQAPAPRAMGPLIVRTEVMLQIYQVI